MTSPTTWATRAAQHFVPERAPGVTVLAYHLIGTGTGLPVDVPQAAFREQIAVLLAHADVVSLDQAIGQLHTGAVPTRRQVVLTFDDAHANFFHRVFPILGEHGLPATLYVPIAFIDGHGEHPFPGFSREELPPMTWAQLGTAAASDLVTIGSHTYSHPDLRGLGAAALDVELGRSRLMLEDRLGVKVSSLCYPVGLVTRAVVAAARRWYETAVIGGGGVATPRRWDPLRIPRVPMLARHSADDLRTMLSDAVWADEWLRHRVRQVRGFRPAARG